MIASQAKKTYETMMDHVKQMKPVGLDNLLLAETDSLVQEHISQTHKKVRAWVEKERNWQR